MRLRVIDIVQASLIRQMLGGGVSVYVGCNQEKVWHYN